MAERRNGMIPYANRRHGSEQRGVVAVPRGPQRLDNLRQSQIDKAKMIKAARLRHDAIHEQEKGLGNQELPVYKHKQEIVSLIENYKAIILGGPTGSGKSTQVPQYLLEAGYRTYMLVPRRIIADGLYERLIEELSEHFGEDEARRIVGIAHGERSEHSEDSRITVMTPNTFAKMETKIRDEYGDDKVAIISDEIHEANLYTEIATGVAAQAVHEHDAWRLIAASATHNTESLQSAFSGINDGFVPSIDIEGRPFEVDIQESATESPMDVYARMGNVHTKSMIFTSGKNEIDHIIEETKKSLENEEKNSSNKVVFRKLHGELNDIELGHINDSIPDGHRLVIVSSPAGMSGITIPGVTLVVTDGTINRSELDDDGVPGLTRRYLSKAEIIQQMGRAGRDVPGGVGVLAAPTSIAEDRLRARGEAVEVEQMPFIKLSARPSFGPPEIYNSNLSHVVLTVASLNRRFSGINPYLPHQVAPSEIIKAEESLARIGALDDEDNITQIGQRMSLFQVRPELSRGIVEAVRRQRSLQQLARIAFITSALETGGVQDFTNKGSKRWEALLRPTTTDDMIAQLDLALTETPYEDQAYADFLTDHDLSYRRMERTQKVARKILRELGVRTKNIVITMPLPDEEAELRRDLTAGMIDFVYEQSRIINRRQHYQNIHGDEDATQRFISNRSIVSSVQHNYVAGFPRWYETALKQGGKRRNDVIELLMPVDPEIVGEYAVENDLLERSELQAYYDGSQVLERYQPVFGSIVVGKPGTGAMYEKIPQKSQNLLVHHVQQQPGPAQKALREVADELELYESRLPEGHLRSYMYPDAPDSISKESITRLIRSAALQTRSAHVIDQEIARYMFKNNVSIQRYFDEKTRQLLQEQTPDEILIDGASVRVHYDKAGGQPYIIGSQPEVRELIKGTDLFLPGGRQILVQIQDPEQGKIRIRASEL